MMSQKRLRKMKRRLLEEQGGLCCWCGREILGRGTFDHILPRCRGGTNSPSNLVVCCEPCNREKADKHPADWLRHLGVKV